MNKIHERLGSHLLHDLSAVLLDGDFTVIELHRDLFVEQSLHDQAHHVAFLRRKLVITLTKFGYVSAIYARQAITFERLIDCRQEFRITNRLGQKLYRSCSHRAHGGWDIAMTGDENYWKINAGVAQLTLQIQS